MSEVPSAAPKVGLGIETQTGSDLPEVTQQGWEQGKRMGRM